MVSKRLGRSRVLAIAATGAITLLFCAGCVTSSTGGGGDKAGGEADPLVLRLANTSSLVAGGESSGLDRHPAVRYFVDRVEELSNGAVRIDVVSEWGNRSPDAEQQVLRDVAAGEIELGWVGTSVFDTVGVTGFEALTAPMLIDSYPLQQAVLDSDIPARMLADLDDLGLHGIAVLADGLRKPIAVTDPLLRPADYRGITFQAFRSTEVANAIRALGAIPTDAALDPGLRDGTINGFEKGLRIYKINDTSWLAPYVTANVNLWPHTVALIGNPGTLGDLTPTQRGWLDRAGAETASRSTDLTDDDADLLLELCAGGARFAKASDGDLAAMRAAFAPHYTHLQADQTTRKFIAQIETMRRSTDPGPALDIPTECTGAADATPTPVASSSTTAGAVATSLDGTYRWTITADDALAHGTPGNKTPESQATFPWIFTLTMNDGHATLKHRESNADYNDGDATYTLNGDELTFDLGGGNVATYTVRVDSDGTLHVDPQSAMAAGDVFVMATHPWTKIAGGSDDAAAADLDGTYRWTLTKEDALTHGLPGDKTPESQATFPWDFTMTMSAGSWHLMNRAGDGESDAGQGVYTVEGDHVVFTEDDERFDFVYTVDADGTVHLDPQPPINPGTSWVFATNPWAKID